MRPFCGNSQQVGEQGKPWVVRQIMGRGKIRKEPSEGPHPESPHTVLNEAAKLHFF